MNPTLEIVSNTPFARDSKPLIDFVKKKNYFRREPKEREYVFNGLLPEPIAAVLAAPGGVGKSSLLLQMAFCLAGGLPFLGREPRLAGSVLYVSAEDDEDEVHRRLWDLKASYPELTDEQLDQIDENLVVWPRVGDDNRLLQINQDGFHRSPMVETLARSKELISNLRLIILDPASRFRSGDENSNNDATRFAETLEYIRDRAQVTVLVAHHVRKGATGDSADDARGGSGLIDAVRFAAMLSLIPVDIVSKYGVSERQREDIVRFKIVKSNYPTGDKVMWLERNCNGVLMPRIAPVRTNTGKRSTNPINDPGYPGFVNWCIAEADADRAKSETELRKLTGKNNALGISQHQLTKFIQFALETGDLIKVKYGKSQKLEGTLPDGKEQA